MNSRALPVTELESPFYRRAGIRAAVLRLDQTHPQISGNKWFKLLPLIRRLEAGARPRLFSFGGVWSNHLHALAFVGKRFGVETLAFVRGHPEQTETAMLRDARSWGMKIHFLGREDYARRSDAEFLDELAKAYPGWECLPEGGSSADAVVGCSEIWSLLEEGEWSRPDLLACALGTGGTLAGLIAGKPAATTVLGVPVLKLGSEAERSVCSLLEAAGYADPGGWMLDTDGSCGGYARLPASLAHFICAFEQRYPVPLEPVYTAKLFQAVNRRIQSGSVAPGSRVLFVHTGGLQGRRGMQTRIDRALSAFQGPQPL
ncbi:1-aminocyclopropane-1-carboxylate deaminase/D-cysteine desulfhydrase [Marinobacterium lutimaris]|uniref:1-aminocyclopropane-1-carboxylate deaminase n=1 Tax=Marinobacterium lutimaris TaxID=568106 RepID=A0A1H5U4Z7_9GAMM|nr:pyridoxal-phosphate dependent enzyme [Marinobacterium lutimaris]SEF70134.1 1-aminocyclopropane-1-carboxylate deaminase [Marinobacterium lutimaris]